MFINYEMDTIEITKAEAKEAGVFKSDMYNNLAKAKAAKDYLFQDVIYRSENQPLPEMAMDVPEAGQYFVRVRAGNKSGYTQDAFDYYVTDSGKNYGMKCFYVTEDNQIEEDTYDEK